MSSPAATRIEPRAVFARPVIHAPLRPPFVFNADPMFIIKGWKGDGHPTIATKDNDRILEVGTKGIENLHFRLIHKPGAMPPRPAIE